MKVTSGEFPSLKEPIHATGKSLEVHVYQNILSRPHGPISVRVARTSIPVVRGLVQSGRDFRQEFRLDIGTLDTNDLRLPRDLEEECHATAYRREVKERFGRRMDSSVPVKDSPLYLKWAEARFGISPFHAMCMALETQIGVRILYAHMGGEQDSFLNGMRIAKYNALIPALDKISLGKTIVENAEHPAQSVYSYDIFFTTQD